ncbi:hypothetical protein N7528_006808 [Penicillium herquei]|nr:hypothetical protein N7528_006808 [Penicillium herquei]
MWKLTPGELIQWDKLHKMEWPGKKVFIWIAVPTKHQNEVKEIGAYMIKIMTVVRESFTNREHEGQFWFGECNRITEKEVVVRRPKMPWLFETKGGYNALHAPDPFFLDDRDRRERLVEAARIEQYVLCTMYKKVFHHGQKHQATLELVVPGK